MVTLVVLLAGGDKRTQALDIDTTLKLPANFWRHAMVRKVKTKTRPYDSAEYLKTDADMAAYLDAVLEDGDPALVTHALGVIARAKGMSQLAQDTGLGRESLYKALSAEGNPEFATVLKVVRALGLKLHAQTAWIQGVAEFSTPAWRAPWDLNLLARRLYQLQARTDEKFTVVLDGIRQ
jgi:probable addiction module antidote protein